MYRCVKPCLWQWQNPVQKALYRILLARGTFQLQWDKNRIKFYHGPNPNPNGCLHLFNCLVSLVHVVKQLSLYNRKLATGGHRTQDTWKITCRFIVIINNKHRHSAQSTLKMGNVQMCQINRSCPMSDIGRRTWNQLSLYTNVRNNHWTMKLTGQG